MDRASLGGDDLVDRYEMLGSCFCPACVLFYTCNVCRMCCLPDVRFSACAAHSVQRAQHVLLAVFGLPSFFYFLVVQQCCPALRFPFFTLISILYHYSSSFCVAATPMLRVSSFRSVHGLRLVLRFAVLLSPGLWLLVAIRMPRLNPICYALLELYLRST